MKERIVVKDEIFAEFLIKNKENHDIGASPKVIMDRCNVEQVPETFEELKDLCEDIKDVDIEEADDLDVAHIIIHKANLFYFEDELLIVAGVERLKIKPEKMWQIIKSLIGEE